MRLFGRNRTWAGRTAATRGLNSVRVEAPETVERRDLPSGLHPLAAPLLVTAGVDSRSNPDGNGVILQGRTVIVGQTAPAAIVRLERASDGHVLRSVRADRHGKYRIPVALRQGRAALEVVASDGSSADFMSDNTYGLAQGQAVAEYVLQNVMK